MRSLSGQLLLPCSGNGKTDSLCLWRVGACVLDEIFRPPQAFDRDRNSYDKHDQYHDEENLCEAPTSPQQVTHREQEVGRQNTQRESLGSKTLPGDGEHHGQFFGIDRLTTFDLDGDAPPLRERQGSQNHAPGGGLLPGSGGMNPRWLCLGVSPPR